MDIIKKGYSEIVGDYVYDCFLSTQTGRLGWSIYVKDDCIEKEHLGEIVSPYKGLDVVLLHECFLYCEKMVESPALPDTVYDLTAAFCACKKLAVPPILPESAIVMRETFKGCEALRTPPKIPPKVNNMANCFQESGIESVPALPNDVWSLLCCFFDCKNLCSLEGLQFPNGSKELNVHGCFSRSSVESVPESLVIPPNINAMTNVFAYCEKLKYARFTVPSTVKNVSGMMDSCESLVSPPVLSEGIKVANQTFSYCSSLEWLPALPESVVEAEQTFKGCIGVKMVDKDFRIPPNDKPKKYFAQFPELETVPPMFRKNKYF